ncbi:MAG: AEC family transporter [Candidatus Fermentithermobacillus carboniphilus]|uniref:AEC family transporter n=1 Tax=Candidatus Fermentithermobacillus carboniphilus TaxID=3085328 RepID=A0AAT9LAC1_9FIRM|nr:MAG: AEC family transporter [Candidatus Fermentithermobacillus carboniphilus]
MPLDAVLPAFLIALVGYVAGKKLQLDSHVLSRVCLYILTPALTFSSLSTSQVDLTTVWRLALTTFLIPFVLIPIFLAVFRLLRWERSFSQAMLLPTLFTNAGNYGLPVCLFAFGTQGMDLGIVFMVTQSMLIATLGVFIAASSHMTPTRALKQVLKMPALHATIAAVLVKTFGISVPEVIGRPISLLAQAAVPIFLLVLGIQLINGSGKAAWKESTVAVILRLVIAPIIVGILGKLLGLGGLAWKILVLQAAMPPPVNATILSQEFNAHPEAVSRVTLAGTAVSVVSLTMWIMILRAL